MQAHTQHQVLEASIAPSQRSLSNHMTTWHHHSPGTELFLHGPVSAHAPLCCIALHPKLNREFTCQMGACYWMASHYKISPHRASRYHSSNRCLLKVHLLQESNLDLPNLANPANHVLLNSSITSGFQHLLLDHFFIVELSKCRCILPNCFTRFKSSTISIISHRNLQTTATIY